MPPQPSRATDYYALLELSRTASADDIKQAIREQRRTWVRRQSSPDPDRRTEAEQRVRDLDQAEKTLLDGKARAAYDRTLRRPGSTGSATSTTTPASTSTSTSGPSAHSGPSAPRDPSNADEWVRHAEACVRRGDTHAAERAWSEAIRLAPDNADAHLGLGFVYSEQNKYRQAIVEFEKVVAYRPGDIDARAGIAESYLHTDRVDEGVAMLRSLLEEAPDDPNVKEFYAAALYEQAWDGLAEVEDGKVALSRRQISLLRTNIKKIQELGSEDPEVQARTAHLQDVLADACRRAKFTSYNKRYYALGIIVGLAMLSMISDVTINVFGAAFIGLVVWIYIRRHHPQMWRIRRKEWANQVTRRGI